MGIVVGIVVFLIIFFIINQVRKNARADNLMKAHGLPLEDRQILMRKYGPSGIDKWVIMRYMADKLKDGKITNYKVESNKIDKLKDDFVQNFMQLRNDFNVQSKVEISFSSTNPRIFYIILDSFDDEDTMMYLTTLIFSKIAYRNFIGLGINKIELYYKDIDKKDFLMVNSLKDFT